MVNIVNRIIYMNLFKLIFLSWFIEWKLPKSPWVSIAEIALDDLFSAYKNARNQMECGEHEEFQVNLVAKVGKILFHRFGFLLRQFIVLPCIYLT